MPSIVEVTMRPRDLIQRLQRFPRQWDAVARKTTEASLLHIQGEIPGYPVAPPDVDDSKRTGHLGRTLGSSQTGGLSGQPAIRVVRRVGPPGYYEGRMGTNAPYAERVIGVRQEEPWSRYWWTLKRVAENARGGVVKLWNAAAEEMARFIDGDG